MKKREPRYRISLPAKVRSEGPEQDAWIRNISRRGMLLQSKSSIPYGSYIQVIAGDIDVVGRVVWADKQYAGLHVRETIDVQAILKGMPQRASGPPANALRSDGLPERRTTPRPEDKAQQSRHIGNMLQYGVVVAFGVGAAVLIFSAVSETLSRSVGKLTGHL